MLSSSHVTKTDNQLILNHPKDIRLQAHLIQCEACLSHSLKLSNIYSVDWILRETIIKSTPKHLHLWLSKSLLNFAGTSHQLHRQKLCNSTVCRCCLTEPELDTLHVLDCKQELFLDFKRDLDVKLQQDALNLTEDDLTPLLLLESLVQSEFIPLPGVPCFVNEDL